MTPVKQEFVVDAEGTRVGVILPIGDYFKLLEEAEELTAIRAFDAAKNSGDEIIPFDQAVREIEQDKQ